MTEPLRGAGDPAESARVFFTAELPALVDGSVSVGIGVPDDWSIGDPAHVAIFDDGGPGRWPVFDAPRVRVTVYADGRARAREVAGLCRALLTYRTVPGVAKVKDPSGILDARDPHTGAILASFHVRAIARTIAI